MSDPRNLLMAQRLAPDDLTHRYNTPLDPAKEFAYQQWLQLQSASAGRDMSADNFDYDTRGAYASGAGQSGNSHWPDTFKKPNHPTFSDQSQYQGADGQTGGTWAGTPSVNYFQPGPANLQQWGQAPLQDYFKRADPDAVLLPPEGGWR